MCTRTAGPLKFGRYKTRVREIRAFEQIAPANRSCSETVAESQNGESKIRSHCFIRALGRWHFFFLFFSFSLLFRVRGIRVLRSTTIAKKMLYDCKKTRRTPIVASRIGRTTSKVVFRTKRHLLVFDRYIYIYNNNICRANRFDREILCS